MKHRRVACRGSSLQRCLWWSCPYSQERSEELLGGSGVRRCTPIPGRRISCTYLSAILLGGLLLNAILGWWSDPVTGLVMIPIILKEGVDGIRAKACCGSSGCH